MSRSALVLAAAVFAAALPTAGAEELNLDRTPESYRSKQRFALEIKGGPYSPQIDSSPGLNGATPFRDLFTDQYANPRPTEPADKPLITLEFDWQFWQGFGSLGVGVSAGFMRRTTHAFEYNEGQSCRVSPETGEFCTRSGDEVALTVFPLALLAVYRFDVLALRYRVPIVPYLKGGLAYYFWFMQRGDASLSKAEKDGIESKGIGGTAGLVAQPGVSIMLDAIDKRAAQALDSELGINHVHLFAELNYAWITGLGFKDKLVFSDLSWNVGMLFEF